MQAVIHTRYGAPEEVLEVREIPKPEIAADEVLVLVHAASVHADVWHVVTGLPYILRAMGAGLKAPKDPVPGTDFAGVVTAVGEAVDTFRVGDAVFGESRRGMQWRNGGTFAEYVAVPHEILAKKPDGVSFEEAACVPTAGYIASINLPREADALIGERVLINGAGGGVGTIALQVAKARGATVTAVDRADKLDMLKTLGADAVVDYAQEDCTRSSSRYDLIFDVASTLQLGACKRILSPTGRYVVIGHDHYGGVGRQVLGSLPMMFGLMARAPFDRHLPFPSFSVPDKATVMSELSQLLAAGKLTPVVGPTFALTDIGDAMRALVEGSARGKILLKP